MIDRDRIVLPLGALATAFVAVLVLGTVYGFFQPRTVAQTLPPQPVPTPIAIDTPTTAAAAPSPEAPPSQLSTAPAARQQSVPATEAAPGPIHMQLSGEAAIVRQTIDGQLFVTVNDQQPSTKVTSLSVELPAGQLTKLCLRTAAQVQFAIEGKPGTQPEAQTTCFNRFSKATSVTVTVTRRS